jgi:hypothetical protein
MTVQIRVGMSVRDKFGMVGEVVQLRTFDGEQLAIIEADCGRLYERRTDDLEQVQ